MGVFEIFLGLVLVLLLLGLTLALNPPSAWVNRFTDRNKRN